MVGMPVSGISSEENNIMPLKLIRYLGAKKFFVILSYTS